MPGEEQRADIFPSGITAFARSGGARSRAAIHVFDFDNHEKGAEQTDFANVDEEWHDEVEALRR